MAAIRVLIADDIAQVRQDLRTLLTLSGDIEVIGEARDGLEAVHLVEILHPEAVLMDLEMPVMDGYEATRQIKARYPDSRVVALTLHSCAAAREKALQAGVDFFIEKGAPLDALFQAILSAKE